MMVKMDIRDYNLEGVSEIVFAIPKYKTDAYYISEHGEYVMLSCDGYDADAFVPKSDVDNLIRALQKAVELGWTK